MHPEVRGDLARFGQLDHVYRWRVAAFPARPAFQRGFELPDRGIPRPPDRIEGKAGASLTAIAFHFEPAEIRHCAIVGDGCAGPPYPSIRMDQASASSRSSSRMACWA